MQKEFFGLDELQELGLPAARTLRNRLNARDGLIRLGGDVPPLPTLRLGGARMVSRAALARWFAAATGEPEPPPGPAKSSDREVRAIRRGRPRKGGAS